MKNIEVIDGALNSRFEIYTVDEETFATLFPQGQQDTYLEDLDETLQEDVTFWERVYAREVDRRLANGIHGVLRTHPKVRASTFEDLVAQN